MVFLLSKPVFGEYRAVLGNPDVTARHPAITPQTVGPVLRRLRYVSEWYSTVSAKFRFERDLGDEPFLELAIVGGATLLITFDNDILALASGYSDAAKRFRQRLPNAAVLDPPDFMRVFAKGS